MIHKLKSGHWPIFLLSSLSSIGNLFLPIILVRLLSPEDIGIYKIFFLHLMALPFLFMTGGPMFSVFYWVGRGEEERTSYLNATWVVTLFLSSLILVVGLPIHQWISEYLDIPVVYVILLLVTGALYSPSGHFAESSIALGRNVGAVFDTAAELIKASGFVYIAWRYKNLLYIFIFFALFMAIKLLIVTLLNKKKNNIGFKTDREHISKVFMYSLPMAISGLMGFFVDKVDMLLLSSHLDASSFAYYSLGCLAVPPLYLLEMSVQKVLIPSISKTYLQQEWKEGAASFRKAIRDIAFLIIPSIFGLVIFATPIVRMLYTDQYLESVPYLQIFAFAYLLLMLPHDSVARASGKTAWILKMYLIITPLSLIAAYYAANYYGAKAVLIISIIIKFIPKILGLKLSKTLMHWQWKDMFPVKHLFLFSLICSILSLGCLLFRHFFANDILWFFVCGSIFGILYLAIANYFGNRGNYAHT